MRSGSLTPMVTFGICSGMHSMSSRSHRGSPQIPVIDLFSGPGGLSEGFAAPRSVQGTGRFRIALSIEKDAKAHETLELRALFRQFEREDVPREYYDFVQGRIDRESLFASDRMREATDRARAEAWRAELGHVDGREVEGRVRAALGRAETSVLVNDRLKFPTQ